MTDLILALAKETRPRGLSRAERPGVADDQATP
jgi:hypothetical protein